MKKLLFLATLLFSFQSSGQHIVVFAREDACSIDSGNPCKREAQPEIDFLTSYKKSITKDLPEKTKRKLETPPLGWGRKVSDQTYGGIAHLETYPGGLVTDLSLINMLPNHAYRLCLNGRPDLAGNDLLPSPVRGNEKEKYLDFLTVTTDAKGEYHASFAIMLKPGNYHVRFYVKDTDDFKIVLYHDYFKFTVM